jgi:hypothetical protein
VSGCLQEITADRFGTACDGRRISPEVFNDRSSDRYQTRNESQLSLPPQSPIVNGKDLSIGLETPDFKKISCKPSQGDTSAGRFRDEPQPCSRGSGPGGS